MQTNYRKLILVQILKFKKFLFCTSLLFIHKSNKYVEFIHYCLIYVIICNPLKVNYVELNSL